MAKKKKVKNNRTAHKSVSNTTMPPKDEVVVISTKNFSFESVKVDRFSNYLKDSAQFTQVMNTLFYKILQEVQLYNFKQWLSGNDKSNYYHFHRVEGKELEIVRKIILKYNTKRVIDFEFDEIYQCGVDSLRVFFIKDNPNIMSLLFLDPHHLVCPSKNYNQNDTNKYSFCMLHLERGQC
ncbi:hypothetical protein [Culicoidibacter larvae]|uniref:Uncharacterized protein n=1 Tax=Culicoidibacter larvae TaxID=2579976 RepID=A0A5R8Q9D4_9FIRM|nr:hypothetical protein [Culicoidibacter larvae]TLG72037.1 hypothetical protein FEZ08_09395 [Culicoidibacter larvae]